MREELKQLQNQRMAFAKPYMSWAKKKCKELGLKANESDILYWAETVAMYKADGMSVADAKMDVEMQMEESKEE